MKKPDFNNDGTIVLIFFCIVAVIFYLLTGCTVNVSESNADSYDYCYADYRCTWYDINGTLVTKMLCYDEIEPNMTCK